MTDSVVKVHKGGGMTFAGPDAVELFRAVTLKSAISLLSKGITPTRGLTSKKAFELCKAYTGKTYKRNQHAEAMKDLDVWLATMKAALPVERDDD